jgi:DNA-binding NarL/FixJ family response regulator
LKPFVFTPREEEVVKFLARGLTYKEIAGGLDISEEAVRKHAQAIFHKLRIHTRTDPRLYAAASSLGESPRRPDTMFPSAPRL